MSVRLRPSDALDSLLGSLEDRQKIELVAERGGLRGLMLARAMQAACARAAGPVIYVGADDASVRAAASDVAFFSGVDVRALTQRGQVLHGPLLVIPEIEVSPYADLSADPRQLGARLGALTRLHDPELGMVMLSLRSLTRRVISPAALAARTKTWQVGGELDREEAIAFLIEAGYRRVEIVEDVGTFAVRGGVMDIFVPLEGTAARLEFFGDELESIRSFDVDTQRSLRQLDEISVHAVRETIVTGEVDLRARLFALADAIEVPSARTRKVVDDLKAGADFFGIEALAPIFHESMAPIWEHLPQGSRWWVDDASGVELLAQRQHEARLVEHQKAVEAKRLVADPASFFVGQVELLDKLRHAEVVGHRLDLYDPDADARRSLLHVDATGNLELRVALQRARADKSGELLRPLVDHVRALDEDADELAAAGRKLRQAGEDELAVGAWRVVLVAPTTSQAERLVSVLRGYGVHPQLMQREGLADLVGERSYAEQTQVCVVAGALSEGFRSQRDRLLVLSDTEIFGQKIRKHAGRKRRRGLNSLTQLAVGDFVVHLLHGVGRYAGMTKLAVKGVPADFALLEYQGRDKLYLPVHRIHEIERFTSAEAGNKAPRLDKLGGTTFAAKTKKIKREVRQLAEELLQIYAQREAQQGHSFDLELEAYRAFEATFPFEETADQADAIEAVQDDLSSERPMDRLVCGDVGFGKTEVALRAAFRVAHAGKQVAILAPTTVLVQQHFLTFADRFSGFALRVGVLNRFTSAKERRETIDQVAKGLIDVVVGTHRLLSKDVRFKDLGLVVIDEEQRFGVAQKERFKKLKTQVDVLTLTATPIPRTLHMGLLGLREISMITTPPSDRLAVRTYVTRRGDAVIEEGIRRELDRGGQVFYVVPRVLGIEEHALKIRELLPDARVVVAHGQMPADLLEKTMFDFLEHRADVLVATTIIESGLDIPRANTMYIAQADMFGLAQLYQLRGRIGRSKLRAHCYLMVNSIERLSAEAKQRLESISRNSELGSGFNVASQDLEIRGAGDLLGGRQHGNIQAIGFEAYARILGEAVAELRGQPISRENDPELAFDLPAFLPDSYVEDTGQRLDFYRRMSGALEPEEVREVMAELNDRFGELPIEARHFAALMICKTYARRLGAITLEIAGTRCTLRLPADVTIDVDRLRKRPKHDPGFRVAGPERLVAELPLRTGEDCRRQLEACEQALIELSTGA